MENKNWVEVDGSQLPASDSRSLWVMKERDLDTTTGSNGTLVFTSDTNRFYVYNKGHVPYRRPMVKRPTILRRWLRRAGWRA